MRTIFEAVFCLVMMAVGVQAHDFPVQCTGDDLGFFYMDHRSIDKPIICNSAWRIVAVEPVHNGHKPGDPIDSCLVWVRAIGGDDPLMDSYVMGKDANSLIYYDHGWHPFEKFEPALLKAGCKLNSKNVS